MSDTNLRLALRANGVFSTFSGIGLMTMHMPLAGYMGIENANILFYIGVALLVFASSLFWYASRSNVSRKAVQFVILQDWLWVAASALIIGAQVFGITPLGYVVIGIVAVIVAGFALLQQKYLPKRYA